MNRRGFLSGAIAAAIAAHFPPIEGLFALTRSQVEPIVTLEGLTACLKQAYPTGSFDWINDEAPFRKALR